MRPTPAVDARLIELLATARDLGVNLIDTAPAYGVSEERLGELLAGRRNDWVCARRSARSSKPARRTTTSRRNTRVAACSESLRRLATDRLDVVLVHSDGNDVDIIDELGTLQTLAQLKQEGLIRAFGMSHKTVAGGLLAVDRCDVVMTTLSADRD